jgi:hypothetical protein
MSVPPPTDAGNSEKSVQDIFTRLKWRHMTLRASAASYIKKSVVHDTIEHSTIILIITESTVKYLIVVLFQPPNILGKSLETSNTTKPRRYLLKMLEQPFHFLIKLLLDRGSIVHPLSPACGPCRKNGDEPKKLCLALLPQPEALDPSVNKQSKYVATSQLDPTRKGPRNQLQPHPRPNRTLATAPPVRLPTICARERATGRSLTFLSFPFLTMIRVRSRILRGGSG